MTSGASRSLLLIHGRDFKPASDAWFDISVEAIRAGIARDYPDDVTAFDTLAKHHAWYGDLTNELLSGLGKTYDEQLDIGDRRNASNKLREIPARKRFGIRQYDSLPGKSALPEFLADVTAPIIGAVGLTMPVLSRMSKDFASYLRADSDYAENVRSRVRDRICELLDRGDRVLLVAHGTGSAVAYDVLWQLSHDREYKQQYGDAKIDMLLTLGSPLGDSNIRKRLNGAKEKLALRYPKNVISWRNVSAEDDFTCHDDTLADDFKKMMDHRIVSAVQDYKIYNLAVRYGRSNPHSSIGYYIHPRISKIVVEWMRDA
jgi:hypothetical protein